MNSSAKLTAVTLLATAALGVAIATQGCTTTSGTDTDFDGGSQTSSSGTSGTSSGSSGTEGGANACPGNTKQTAPLIDATCQTCLSQKCCSQLTTCFDLPADTDGGTTNDCNSYSKCTADCLDDTDVQGCYQLCDELAAPGVVTAYDSIVSCGETSCKVECQFGDADPDAGGDGG
jgi:hypothetical protein